MLLVADVRPERRHVARLCKVWARLGIDIVGFFEKIINGQAFQAGHNAGYCGLGGGLLLPEPGQEGLHSLEGLLALCDLGVGGIGNEQQFHLDPRRL